MTTESALIKLRLSTKPPTGVEIYSFFTESVGEGNNAVIQRFLRRYKNKDVVPTL